MLHRFSRTALALGLAVQLTPAPVFAETIEEIADIYLSAVREQDWEKMRSLLAVDARYQDFTMEHFGVAGIDLKGPEAIVGFWRDSSADSGTLSIRFDFPDRFTAGPHLILRGHSEVEILGSSWELPVEVLETRFPQITHLRIAEGKVTYHSDHVDYATAERQIATQVELYNREHGTHAVFPITKLRTELFEQAIDYLAALHHDDWQGLERWLGPESTYVNFTAESVGGSIERADGASAMLELFRNAHARSGTSKLELEVESRFVAGPNVFLQGIYHVETSGNPRGSKSDVASFQIPMIVHLRFAGRTVHRHAEYMDYATGIGQESNLE